MSDEPQVIDMSALLQDRLKTFLEVFNARMIQELNDIQKDAENIANVYKHHMDSGEES